MSQKGLLESRRKFLEETISFYNSTNRALDEGGNCVYHPTKNSPGCAIGRHMSKEALEKVGRSSYAVSADIVYEWLPMWIKELGKDFLVEVQRLHDRFEYWEDTGLSERGEEYVSSIKNTYCQ